MGVYNKIGFEPYNSIISDANHEQNRLQQMQHT